MISEDYLRGSCGSVGRAGRLVIGRSFKSQIQAELSCMSAIEKKKEAIIEMLLKVCIYGCIKRLRGHAFRPVMALNKVLLFRYFVRL